MPIDPCCGVEIDKSEAVGTIEHDGVTYYFCSKACRERFKQNPDTLLHMPMPHLESVEKQTVPRLPFGEKHPDIHLHLQDSRSLNVGDWVEVKKRISEEDVHNFARASGDTNALHLNEEFARETRFKRRIIHGTLVAGTISSALASLPGMTIYLSQSLEFKAPADIGETLVSTCKILEDLGDGKYRLETQVKNARGNLLIDGEAVVLIDPIPEKFDHTSEDSSAGKFFESP